MRTCEFLMYICARYSNMYTEYHNKQSKICNPFELIIFYDFKTFDCWEKIMFQICLTYIAGKQKFTLKVNPCLIICK